LYLEEAIGAMSDLFARISTVNPLVWVVIALAAVLGYGAKKWVSLMKIPEEKRQRTVIIIKSASLLLVVLVFIYVVTTQ
jgi:MFS superfamily sulfate permease-like transporter